MSELVGLAAPLNLDEFFQALLEPLTAAPHNFTPASELTENAIDLLPFVLHSAISDGQTLNGPGAWRVDLTLSAFQTGGKAELNKVTDVLYTTVHGWAAPGAGVVDDIGYVNAVEDSSLFSPPATSAMLGKQVRQSNGIFILTIRSF